MKKRMLLSIVLGLAVLAAGSLAAQDKKQVDPLDLKKLASLGK